MVLVNRSDRDVTGPQLEVPATAGAHFYDLWNGVELTASAGAAATLRFGIERHGFGAILAVEAGAPPERVAALLPRMRDRAKTRLADLSAQWNCLRQAIVDIPPTAPAQEPAEGMVLVRGGSYRFKVAGVEIEGDNNPGVDFQYPWEDVPHRHHDKEMDIQGFFIDKYPVTNAQFKRFLDASGYKPKDDHNFLKSWQGGTYPSGQGPQAGHLGFVGRREGLRRLGRKTPTARMGMAVRGAGHRRPAFSLGQDADPAALPNPESGRELREPTDVDAYPKGASPFGVMDLVGNVWQWTDEYVDEHTRAAVVRGGGYYRPDGSMWYFPHNTRLDQHGKYLLMAPSKDRSPMLGFRCVVDRAADSAK